MPIIIQPEGTRTKDHGEGWAETTLADRELVGEVAMVARHWILKPGAHGPERESGDAEHLLYVIRGRGTAVVGDERLPLAPESMVWLEAGDRYRLEAGDEGLEVLQAYAPEAAS
jgi:quercetin dioxygenase-like cupin family protein